MISSLYSSPIDSIGREKAEPKSDSCCRQVTSAFSKRPWLICFSLDRDATSHFDGIARFAMLRRKFNLGDEFCYLLYFRIPARCWMSAGIRVSDFTDHPYYVVLKPR